MKIIQQIGAGLFAIALILLTLSLSLSTYTLTEDKIKSSFPNLEYPAQAIATAAEEQGILGKEYSNQFSFISALNNSLNAAQQSQQAAFEAGQKPEDVGEWSYKIGNTADFRLTLVKAASGGILKKNSWLLFGLTFLLGVVGALMYILPKFKKQPGIKNDGIFHSKLHNRGWLGIIVGTWLILFYVALYFFPSYLAGWIILVDPISQALSGNPASQWFLYGFMYTLAILVMGVRMFAKYRHSAYHMIRTTSIMFFQTAFAFIIPEILVRFNQPYYDFKNMWPLDYDFFFEWHLGKLIENGTLGWFMLFWGIILFSIGVPLFTYLYGKRWYCSWVCGCGGLAETLGDPYRQLSDKSLKAWKIERWMIHAVLVFAVIMTILVLATYFTGGLGFSYTIRSIYGFAIGSIFSGVIGTGFYPLMGNRVWCRFGCPLAAYLGIIQRFKSRFRITTNGGQCISCGNCSTYCEMGIDVRSYAQKGQDIVRASCVGCGVCSSVCPRGVLRLETGPAGERAIDERVIHISEDEVKLLA